jgi:hypothetical protein
MIGRVYGHFRIQRYQAAQALLDRERTAGDSDAGWLPANERTPAVE